MKTLSVLFLLVSLLPLHALEVREFTNKDGDTIQAELLSYEEGSVRMRIKGRVYNVAAETLSEEDQKWLAEWKASQAGDEEEGYYSELIFEDDFSGEGFGEAWKHYKSESVVQDGVLIGKTIDINDHAGVDNIRFEGRQDMEVAVKFNFAGEEATRFNVWFDDKDYKGAHAGHICSVSISPAGGSIVDAKTGNMENSIYEMKKSPAGLDDATKELLATKTANFKLDLERGEWQELLIRTRGNVVTAFVNGEEVASLESEGLSHATKSLVSLTTNINDVHYDDFVIKAAPASSESDS